MRLLELGAHVEIVDKPASNGGYQHARLDRLAGYLKGIADSYWHSLYSNADNPLACAKLAELLIKKAGKIDCLFGMVGSGGSMCGTSKYVGIVFPELDAVGVDSVKSSLFGQACCSPSLSKLGGNLLHSNINHPHFDKVHWLTPAFDATRQLHRDNGLFMSPAPNPNSLQPHALGHLETVEPIKQGCGAMLEALSHVDHAKVAHLNLEPEQEQFVDPLGLVFSELQNSSRRELEHPFSIIVRHHVVGFFVLREKAAVPEWSPPDAITLHSFRVGQAYQGNGYGKTAIRRAAGWILTNRPYVTRLMLGVNVRNVTARETYLKSGFWDTGVTFCGPIGPQNILEYKVGLSR
ncbi:MULTISPECIES: GNAT family N-acetyltransferase [unclassified Mesorhizobium]|uniref:GNAT family N-acetyltransferase n=1 Tax=unclassified Mesorhizobium TaxID=325217 RepID=UPI00333CD609